MPIPWPPPPPARVYGRVQLSPVFSMNTEKEPSGSHKSLRLFRLGLFICIVIVPITILMAFIRLFFFFHVYLDSDQAFFGGRCLDPYLQVHQKSALDFGFVSDDEGCAIREYELCIAKAGDRPFKL